jgi:hypothetical protein
MAGHGMHPVHTHQNATILTLEVPCEQAYDSSMKAVRRRRQRASGARATKNRRTFSLSRDVVELLETGCAETQAPSMSAYLETIVRDLQARAELAQIEANTVAYYDSLSDAAMEEQSDWGRVGAATISRLED